MHSLKALSPIVVTLEGMLIEVKPLQRENADDPIVVTLHKMPSHSIVDGITISPLYLFALTSATCPLVITKNFIPSIFQEIPAGILPVKSNNRIMLSNADGWRFFQE